MNACIPSGPGPATLQSSGELTHPASVLCAQTLASLRALSESGSTFLLDLGSLYLATAPQLLNNLSTAYAEGNLKLAKRIAHQLFSSSKNMGLLRVADGCARLQLYRGSPLCEEGALILHAIATDFAEGESALRSELGLALRN